MIFSGTTPYILTETIDGFSNIFFETTSGYTATGASIINDVEILPEGILFWRSITHWLGGMGMIVHRGWYHFVAFFNLIVFFIMFFIYFLTS